MNTHTKKITNRVIFPSILLMALAFVVVLPAFAQGQQDDGFVAPRGADSSGSQARQGDQDQLGGDEPGEGQVGDMDQDMDQTKQPEEPGAADDPTQVQDRDQTPKSDNAAGTGGVAAPTAVEAVPISAPAGGVPATADQDRVRDPNRIQDQTNVATSAPQTQTQNMVRVETPEQLEQFIQMRVTERLNEADLPEQAADAGVARARVATEAMQAAAPLLGGEAPRMSEVAEEMNQAYQGLEKRETALETRSWLRTFLFGQDQEVVGEMQQIMNENAVRIEELNRLLRNCNDCDGQVQVLLLEELQVMEEEQERLRQVIGEAESARGILGLLFGWL